jgi:hypothetical protein
MSHFCALMEGERESIVVEIDARYISKVLSNQFYSFNHVHLLDELEVILVYD